ncbi:ferric-chelate reductase 1 [Plakobranchus ocellatus]|uniref:Ferric-chelate reductase 1 n=1 Tax=Plakobranchus ocellatus TaxID=259542 RepID=A0AAV4DUN9_9GAST|nr:ferric-chelate reductase 1 [Plakobranchus ocellatus]
MRVSTVSSYSSGALDSSCALLDPSGHGASTATGPAPYSLELSKTEYQPGDVIQVTLRGNAGAQFKGYLVAGRRADGGSSENIGEFSVDTNGNSKLLCAQPLGNALTHTEASPKSSVEFTWTAPSSPQGDVVLHYTVVRGGAPNTASNRADYFQDLRSAVITGPPVPTVALDNSFSRDPACGVSKGCYSDCVNNECGWEATWQESGSVYNITLTSVFDGSDDKYVALGFSTRPAMAEASVLACVATGGQVDVEASYNPGYSNIPVADPTEGLTVQQVSYDNGILRCEFSKDKLSSDPQMFNLTEPWYIITARGSTASDGTIQQHDSASRFHTSAKIDLSLVTIDEKFSTKTTTPNPGTPTQSTATSDRYFAKDPTCGKTNGCYSDCDDDRCTLLLAWAPANSTHFHFSMQAVYTGTDDFYIAMGFSTQNKMDRASVVACTVVDGIIDVYQSFNPGYYNLPLADPKEGLSNIQGNIDDGVMRCTFTRVSASASNDMLFDLTQTWNLIVALGKASTGGVLQEHNNKNRYVTSSRINFLDLKTDISLEELDYPLIQAHACLMIIGWMISGSIGIAIARFSKKHWPNTTIFGLKVWFQVHRACMMLVFVMGSVAIVLVFVEIEGYSDVSVLVVGSVAIVLVFVEIEGYSDIHGETYKKAHPVLGLITTGLMVINPIMAFFRVGPDHPQRYVFNWSHWAVGTSAHILAGVTISLGMYLPKSQMDKDLGLLLMIIYGCWHFVYGVISGVLDYLGSRSQRRAVSANTGLQLVAFSQSAVAQAQAPPSPDAQSQPTHSALSKAAEINTSSNLLVDPLKKEEPPNSGALKCMLYLHGFVVTAISAFLVFLVIEGED